MGDAKRLRDRVLADERCIYCTGSPETIDHVPPKIMFLNKQRPKGLEFAACKACNEGTKGADLVAALIGRADPTNDGMPDFQGILQAISNNYPGLLEELTPSDNQMKAAGRVSISGGPINVAGPQVSKFMRQFCLKLTFALYREIARRPVDLKSGVIVRWFSNFEHMTGKVPQDMFSNLMPLRTLAQGSKSVSDQFSYSHEISPGGDFFRTTATFRYAFAVAGFVAPMVTLTDPPQRPTRPGELLAFTME